MSIFKLKQKFNRPGTYEFDVARNRKVQMFHSFGGPTHMIPIVETKCISIEEDKVRKKTFIIIILL
jgi:hypothetical protein